MEATGHLAARTQLGDTATLSALCHLCSDAGAVLRIGYLDPACVAVLDRLIAEATAAGLWVILTARAHYIADDDPEGDDLWRSPTLRRRFLAMWGWVAARYSSYQRIAGYEILSEPRTRETAPEHVSSLMRDGCDAVHARDPRALCVVGPAPYYKVFNFDERILLDRENV